MPAAPLRTVRSFSKIVFVLAAASAASHLAHAQNRFTPVYQGGQPDLVTGIQDGLATDKPLIRHAYLAAPDVLAVVIDSQAIVTFPVEKYFKQPGDEIIYRRPQEYGPPGTTPFYWGRTIMRGGKPIGDIVGPDNAHYSPPAQRVGQPLDITWASQPASYSIAVLGNASAITPVAVYRKTKPEIIEWTGEGKQEAAHRHEIYLKFPAALTPRQTYTLNFVGSPQLPASINITVDDTRLRTEAIQVNQVGYHPKQAERLARLSMWIGSGGGIDFDSLKTFHVVDDKTSAVVYTGNIALRRAATPGKTMPPERTDDPTDDLPTAVYHLDFSPLYTPGTYRIIVPGLGSSFPFRIDSSVWEESAKMSAHGYLNQRSGIALGPPHTKYVRPRNFHPADGVKIHRIDPALFYDPVKFIGGGNPFKRIQASILPDTKVPEAWGGWHDAADYDRSVLPQNHPRAVQAMLWLYQSNPAYFDKLNLNLPESGNGIPDIINEAIWCMDLFRRIQQPDGGIPSAVESIEHPSEPSYLLAQPTAITPPTPQTCHLYAAAAFQLAVALEKHKPDLAKTYRDSALHALDWAANNSSVPNIYARNLIPADQHESLAYLWAYAATEDAKWHDRFKQHLPKLHPTGQITFGDAEYNGPWSFVDYLLLPEAMADAALRGQSRAAVISAADAKIARISKYTYYLRGERYNWDERLGIHWELAAAHRLTGDPKYILAMERQANLGLGANPSNTSYTTGLGSRQVVPFNLESRYLGAPYPEGISTIGPAPRNSWAGTNIEERMVLGGLSPEWTYWPWAESNFNYREPMINEYVVGGNFANVLLTRAYLAQHYAAQAADRTK